MHLETTHVIKMAKRKCMRNVKDGMKLLFTLSWMSCIVYALLMKLVQDDIPDKSHSLSGENYILMSDLGFHEHPKLYPQAYHFVEDKEWPIFVLALESRDIDAFIDFILSFRKHFLDHRLVIFNLGMDPQQKTFVSANSIHKH